LAHACENDCQHGAAEYLAARSEECVDGWTAEVLQRQLIQVYARTTSARNNPHVKIPRSNKHPAGLNQTAMACFRDPQLARQENGGPRRGTTACSKESLPVAHFARMEMNKSSAPGRKTPFESSKSILTWKNAHGMVDGVGFRPFGYLILGVPTNRKL
jgi:hypothetical protein